MSIREKNGAFERKQELAICKLKFSKKVVDTVFKLWYDNRAEMKKNFNGGFENVYIYGKTC